MKDADFLAAAIAEQEDTGRPTEICAVLNRMRLPEGTSEILAEADEVMDRLYRGGRLFVPGHRWLSECPASIAGHLISLYERGAITRIEGRWLWEQVTSWFSVR